MSYCGACIICLIFLGRYLPLLSFFFFNDTATTEIYTLSLHDALPIWTTWACLSRPCTSSPPRAQFHSSRRRPGRRSEEHTSELQSRQYLVCRLLLEKKKKKHITSVYLYLKNQNKIR